MVFLANLTMFLCLNVSGHCTSSKFSTARASGLFTTVCRSISVSRDPVTLSSSATASAPGPVGSVWLPPRTKQKNKGELRKREKSTYWRKHTRGIEGGRGRCCVVQERNRSIPNLPGREGEGRGKTKKSLQLSSEGATEGSWWDGRKSRTQLGLHDLFTKLSLSHSWAEEGAEVKPGLGAAVLEQAALQHAARPVPHRLASAWACRCATTALRRLDPREFARGVSSQYEQQRIAN